MHRHAGGDDEGDGADGNLGFSAVGATTSKRTPLETEQHHKSKYDRRYQAADKEGEKLEQRLLSGEQQWY